MAMCDASVYRKRHLLAAALGAMTGGVLVAVATQAIPKMISQMMSGIMQDVMARMETCGCDPAEM